MKKRFVIVVLMLCQMSLLYAQDLKVMDRMSVGIGGGWHTNAMRFSALDRSMYPDRSNSNSGVFTLFAQYDIDYARHFAVRPEFAFLRRGGKLNNIGIPAGGYPGGLEDVFYQLDSRYFDIRIPVMYSFLDQNATFRPYLALAPVLGFSTGGTVRLQQDYMDSSYHGNVLKLSDATIAAAYFALSLNVGARYQVKVADRSFAVVLEAGYELGFTDTYSRKETNGEITSVNGGPARAAGTRKHSGFEVKATVSVPLSVFKKRSKHAPAEEPVYSPEPAPLVDEPLLEEKPFYTLEEIDEMMLQGVDVTGKTIGAVDAIYFDRGKSVIKRESHEYLDRLAEILRRTGVMVEVKGHTDNTGTEEFNMKISRERALAVVEYLVGKGVSQEKLLHSYYGMSRPIESNDTESGRRVNRRVEFEILK